MPTIFDIDTDQQADDLMPPDKRGVRFLAFAKAILKPLAWLVNSIWYGWKDGTVPSDWAAGTYYKYDQVTFLNQVFECVVTSTSTDPSNLTDWRLIQTNFIGVSERQLYNGSKIELEYALNKWFHTTYRQDPAVADINIETKHAEIGYFITGTGLYDSSVVYATDSSEYVGVDQFITQAANFKVNIPSAVYVALASDDATRTQIVRNFVNKYVIAGVYYTVAPY